MDAMAVRTLTGLRLVFRVAFCVAAAAGLMQSALILAAPGDSALDPLTITALKGLEDREARLQRVAGVALVDTYMSDQAIAQLAAVLGHESTAGFRDRDRAIARFSADRAGYRLEAASLYWGGASPFFVVDVDRESDDVSDLWTARGTRAGCYYVFSHQRPGPSAWYAPDGEDPCGFWRDQHSQWLGLSGSSHEPMSGEIRRALADARDIRCELLPAGVRGDRLLRLSWQSGQSQSGSVSRSRYDIAPDRDWAVLLASQITRGPSGETRGVIRIWQDVSPVDNTSVWLPRRHTRWQFHTDDSGAAVVDRVVDVSMSSLATETERDSWLDFFPVGTYLVSPQSQVPEGFIDGYRADLEASRAVWGATVHWSQKPWGEVVPAVPPVLDELLREARGSMQ